MCSILLLILQAVGISVEFCSHLVHSFAVSVKDTRVQRAADSLTRMGSSVSRCPFRGMSTYHIAGDSNKIPL
jgi:hypothetical protein